MTITDDLNNLMDEIDEQITETDDEPRGTVVSLVDDGRFVLAGQNAIAGEEWISCDADATVEALE